MPLQLVVAIMLLAIAFFRLPFAFPVSPSVSASYVFQFNNRVAVLVFLVGATVFAVYFRGLSLRPATRDSRVSLASASCAVVLCVVLGAIYYWLSIPDGLQGEVPYFYGRLAQLAAGKTIYRDFEFAYGPLWLYLPYWTGKLFHLTLIHGYILFWLADWAVGIWLLYRLVNAIDIPSPYRTPIFFLFVLDFAGSLLPQGINYAPVRTLLTASLSLLVFTVFRQGHSMPVVAATASLSAALAAAVSPEHGIAFMLGTVLYFGLCVRTRPDRYWPSLAVMALCFLGIVAVSEKTRVYTTLHAFSSGGYNYPIMPIPAVLCVLGLYLLAACAAYIAFHSNRRDSLTVYLLCVCLFGMPACFGRADSGHMQLGAFSALLVAALSLGRYPLASLLAAVAFFHWPATAPFAGQFTPIREQVERRLFDPTHPAQLPNRVAVFVLHRLHRDAQRQIIEAKVAQFLGAPRTPELPAGVVVDAPWNFTRRKVVDTSDNVDYGYFFGMENVILPSQVDSILLWIQAHPERSLILPYDWQRRCRSFEEGEEPSLQVVYGRHWASPIRSMQVLLPLCDFIETRYAPDLEVFSLDNRIWHPIPTPSIQAHSR
jgi:hypothetical protein